MRIRRSPLMRLVVAPVTFAALTAGCTHWSIWRTPGEPTESRLPDRVRVTYMTDGPTLAERQVELHSARVKSDSLIGQRRVRRARFEDLETPPEDRMAIALGDVRKLEGRTMDWVLTGAIVGGTIALSIILWQSVDWGDWGFGDTFGGGGN